MTDHRTISPDSRPVPVKLQTREIYGFKKDDIDDYNNRFFKPDREVREREREEQRKWESMTEDERDDYYEKIFEEMYDDLQQGDSDEDNEDNQQKHP